MSPVPQNTDDFAAVQFTAGTLLHAAQQLPCKDAVKLLRGFLLIADPAQFPEIRALYQTLNHCDAQLSLLAAQPIRIAA